MSGRKNILQPYAIIADGDMSNDLVSEPTNVQYLDRLAIQLIWTDSPVGDFAVETSLNYNPLLNAGDWTAYSFSPSPAATGAADSIFIDLTVTSAPYLRVSYTATSGAGTLQAYISGKMS